MRCSGWIDGDFVMATTHPCSAIENFGGNVRQMHSEVQLERFEILIVEVDGFQVKYTAVGPKMDRGSETRPHRKGWYVSGFELIFYIIIATDIFAASVRVTTTLLRLIVHNYM
jgi:hypothetical protein